MTSIHGDFRSALGLPHETWFERLAQTEDWSTLGRPISGDPARLRETFLIVWGLSTPSLIISYPREFHIDPRSAEARAARDALASLGANELVGFIDRLAAPPEASVARGAPQPAASSAAADRERELAEMQERHDQRRLLESGREVRSLLIAWLTTAGVFPLEPEDTRTPPRVDPADLRRLEEYMRLNPGKTT